MRPSAAPLLLLAITAGYADGAIIRGTVVEKRTNYSLSRASVTLETVPAVGDQARTARTNETGQFEFANLPAGAYIIKASRRGFMPMEYGQRRWNSAGTAIIVRDDDSLSLQLPLARFGAITGTVRDNNEVGIPDQDVAAYTTTQPPRYVARAKADDRGVFRIGGLEPGDYLIRTTGNTDEDRSYLPTFSRQTLRVEEARPLVVYADEDTPDGDVRPISGKLFDLSGGVTVPPGNFNITITLASEMGRTFSSGPAFRFTGLAPGRYEIYAEAVEGAPGMRVLGGYTDIPLDRNQTNFVLPMQDTRDTQFALEGAGPSVSATALVRRKDYAGVGAAREVRLSALGRVQLFPGRWEIMVQPPAGYYVASFSPRVRNSSAVPQGWNEVLISGYSRISASLSSGPGSLQGTVHISNMPAIAAPVFLETWDPVTRARLTELQKTRTDVQGNYKFGGLAPGNYRLLSTFEYTSPDPQAFDVDETRGIRVESATNAQVDLELSGMP